MRWWRRRTFPRVFISYRRDDSAAQAHSLYMELRSAFGESKVFFDVADIDYGDRFAPIIDAKVGRSDVVVVVIGPQWHSLGATDGSPRIQRSDDYVRHEIAAALAQGKRVIPVMVGGRQRMPDAAGLPTDIAELAAINAQAIDDQHLREGSDRLIDAILEESTRRGFIEHLQRLLATRVGMAVAVAVLLGAWIGLFDLVGLDTRTASATLWLADRIAPVPPAPDLQIVVIDRATERVRNRSFTGNFAARADHAELIRRLAQASARSIAFDLYFSAPSAAADAELVEAVEGARRAGTAVVFGVDGFDAGAPVIVPALRAALTNWAVLCFGERLGYAGTVPLASRPRPQHGDDRAARPVLGLALAAAYPGPVGFAKEGRKILVSRDGIPAEVGYSQLERVRIGQGCQVGRPGDEVATALYRSVPASLLDAPALRSKYESVLALDDASLKRRFSGRTVLVGLEMPGRDEHRVFAGWALQTRHGLALHADATSALLSGAIVRPVPLAAQFGLTALLGWLGARLSRWRPGGSAWPARAALLAATAVGAAAAVWLCMRHGLLLNLTYPAAALWIGHRVAGRFGVQA